MKKKSIYNSLIVGLIIVMLALQGGTFFGGDISEVKAAGDSHVEKIDITAYQDGETTPKPAEKAYKDWLFAGWYLDEACTQVIRDKADVQGEQYAKFVSHEVLSVKCQITQGVTADSEVSKLRLISTVDSLKYQNIGFEIQFGDKNSFTYNTKSVCQTIEEVKDGVTFKHGPDVFHESSKYFVTVTLINISSEDFSTGFYIKPYWTTMDGVRVYGVTRYARVEDSYLNIINVPVRMYSDENVVGGYLEVKYDDSKFEYVDYDDGNVFTTYTAVDNESKIRCVASMTSVKKNVKADGMYLNLRFKCKDEMPNEDVTFWVEKEDFCDKDEQDIVLNISNTVYKAIR